MATRQKTLCGHRRHGAVLIDMESVYRKINHGMSAAEVAKELGVSRTTLYVHHRKYQQRLERLAEKGIDIDDVNESNLSELEESDDPNFGTEKSMDNENMYPELPKEYL